jgi:hypothetical protein
VDLGRLRELLRQPIVGLFHSGHKELPNICARLGLPPPPGEGSRRERIQASFAAVGDSDLLEVAERYLREFAPPPLQRNAIQDVLWADMATPSIPKKFRREVAQALTADDLYLDVGPFDTLLASLWVVEDDPLAPLLGVQDTSLRGEIERHVYRKGADLLERRKN